MSENEKQDISIDYIENIYSYPMTEREYALALNYPIVKINSSPGRTIDIPHNPLSESFKKIKQYFLSKGIDIEIVGHSYRISKEKDYFESYIHTDYADYQIIIPLSPEIDKYNEKEYYFEHNDTKISRVHYLRYKYDIEYKNICTLACRGTLNCTPDDITNMSIIASEDIKFNKALILDCSYFHAPSSGHFGKTNETSRLIEIYAIKIKSMYINKNYPYIWYYNNIIEDIDCNNLINIMNNDRCDKLVEIGKYKSNMISKMLHVYFRHIHNVTPDLNEFLSMNQDNIDVVLDINCEYLPQFYRKNWNYELNNTPATFFFILQLNDNQTGLTIYNHFTKESEVIETKKGSLIIYPRSWLYPISQTRILKGDKYIIKGTITVVSKE